jgi:hypothetical protein
VTCDGLGRPRCATVRTTGRRRPGAGVSVAADIFTVRGGGAVAAWKRLGARSAGAAESAGSQRPGHDCNGDFFYF